ncbi:MAG: glycoside hydrolase family 140 protein [Bacteroidales bacterium]|nr:glycoside hydrolase family 140 protein [Bacteroidales bacterium]
MLKKSILIAITILTVLSCRNNSSENAGLLKISDNRRFFTDSNGNPFFWLGDTGWLLFKKLNREEGEQYLENRRQKGFNVIQVMLLHDVKDPVNYYGDSALVNNDITKSYTTPGNSYENPQEYDYWDHVDYLIDVAASKGIYLALVPVWGSNIKSCKITPEQGRIYAEWLAERFKDKHNVIWLNGGDIPGSDSIDIWNAIGYILWKMAPDQLVTFHPRGRTHSSKWYHDELWLDFNMFQSGHRRYDQDDTELAYGEDNWRFVEYDYNLTPVKPTLDGEPSYEDIPQGLHDTLQPFWNDNDVRRYAYWSVFTGAGGHTYGHNSVMQFYKPEDTRKSYGARKYWFDAINDPGAGQIKYIKDLMLSVPYFERIPDNSMVAVQGEKYDYQPATRGKDYAMIYTYNGRNIGVHMGKISGNQVRASWFNPREGSTTEIGNFENKGTWEFIPPGEKADGNDWVLILKSIQ